MVILEESSWYQEIFKKGEEQGCREVLISSLELMLEIKFGNEGLELMSLISSIIDLHNLKEIQLAIKNLRTVNELEKLINNLALKSISG
ncbi:MAG TPA: hypothetical protein VK203_12825 [Nostocaceae cyanobacterium]|nr:hypothetical protein [Nostocaceae cyanobacterium]